MDHLQCDLFKQYCVYCLHLIVYYNVLTTVLITTFCVLHFDNCVTYNVFSILTTVLLTMCSPFLQLCLLQCVLYRFTQMLTALY